MGEICMYIWLRVVHRKCYKVTRIENVNKIRSVWILLCGSTICSSEISCSVLISCNGGLGHRLAKSDRVHSLGSINPRFDMLYQIKCLV